MYGRGYNQLGFGPPVTPRIIKQLLIANLVIFLAELAIRGIYEYGAVTPFLVWQKGYLWQPITYMWLHSPYHYAHIIMNLFVLWMFGSQLALAWGARRFLRYYLICGIGAGVIIATWPYLLVGFGTAAPIGIPTVGASGAIYGVLLAYSLTWPERTIMLIFPPVAFRAIWLIPILFGATLFFGGSNVSHVGHLGGVIVGWLYLRRRGETASGVNTLKQLRNRWRRYRMRQKLRAIRYEDHERRRDDERRLH